MRPLSTGRVSGLGCCVGTVAMLLFLIAIMAPNEQRYRGFLTSRPVLLIHPKRGIQEFPWYRAEIQDLQEKGGCPAQPCSARPCPGERSCPEPEVHVLLDFCWDSVTEASLWFSRGQGQKDQYGACPYMPLIPQVKS